MKRKRFMILTVILSIFILLIAAVALGISPFAKNYIEKHSKELIGRKILMKDLNFNIFSGVLQLESIRMYETDDRTVFASLDSFYLNLSLTNLISSKIEVTKLSIIRPYIRIAQKGTIFNFDDLIPKENHPKVEKKESSFPKSIVIKDIYVNGGKLVYTDLLLKNTIRMNDLGVAIPELAFEKGNTNAGIHLKIGDTATLNSQLAMNMQTSEYLLKLQIKSLPINIIEPYIKEYYNIGTFEGTLNSDLLVKGNTNHVMDFSISGTATGKDFSLTNGLGEPVAYAKEASVNIDSINLQTYTYLFNTVDARGVKLNFILQPTVNNFSALLKPEETGKADSISTPMTVKVGKLHLSESELVYTDKTLHASTFSVPISKIDFNIDHFDMNGTNQYMAKASVPNGGKIYFSWKGNMNDLSNQEIIANFQNINLNLFSPYCLDYTAYDITKGNMNFITHNHIRGNYINSTNKIDIYNISVGKKHKEMKVEYNIPLRLGLYILKDKDDKIQFDIPVKGDMNNPEFSYKKIIFKTIVNLMVKVAVSPVRFLSSSFGLDPDKMSFLPIDALQSGMKAQQYSQLNELADLYKKKPDMILKLIQYVDWNASSYNCALDMAKKAYLRTLSHTTDEHLTDEDAQAVDTKDRQFMNYLDEALTTSGQTISLEASLKDKLHILFPEDSVRQELSKKLESHNYMIKSYLAGSCNIPQEKILIGTAAVDTLMLYNGKSQYKIDLNLPSAQEDE